MFIFMDLRISHEAYVLTKTILKFGVTLRICLAASMLIEPWEVNVQESQVRFPHCFQAIRGLADVMPSGLYLRNRRNEATPGCKIVHY